MTHAVLQTSLNQVRDFPISPIRGWRPLSAGFGTGGSVRVISHLRPGYWPWLYRSLYSPLPWVAREGRIWKFGTRSVNVWPKRVLRYFTSPSLSTLLNLNEECAKRVGSCGRG